MDRNHSTGSDLPALNRRGFLRLGVTGSVALAGVSVLAGLGGCASTPAEHASPTAIDAGMERDWHFLQANDRVLLAALMPAIVGPEFPASGQAREDATLATLEGMDVGLHHMGPPNQSEFRQLFDLLEFGPTRLAMARVMSSWENVDEAQAEAFLQRWRHSRIGLFNNAYLALVQVTNAAWYGNPDNFPLSGYPGPPDWVRQALPQMQSQTG